MNVEPRIIIFSADTSFEDYPFSREARRKAEAYLRHHQVPYVKVATVRKETVEYNYLVIHPTEDDVNLIIDLCRSGSQESVLISECDRETFSISLATGKREYIGRLQGISQEKALRLRSYIYAPHSRAYYACVKG